MKILRRSVVSLLVLFLVAYAAAMAWLVANETRLVFAAGRPLGDLRPAPPFEAVDVPGSSGPRQLMWVMRASSEPDAKPWVIFLHGNDANVASRMNITHYEGLRRIGLNVVAPEYRGFGGVEGVPTESGIESDARAAYNAMSERLHVDPRKVVIYGWSLGSAVAVDLASHVGGAAVILEGAPASVVAIGQQRYPIFPVRLLIRNPFESILKIGAVKAPKLFLHSRGDTIIPIEEGRRLFDAAPQPKEWVEVTGGHVHAAEKDPTFFQHVQRFLVERRVMSEGDGHAAASDR
jgi:fermentation-respiration switch protein FrsA (DUF1100 family)